MNTHHDAGANPPSASTTAHQITNPMTITTTAPLTASTAASAASPGTAARSSEVLLALQAAGLSLDDVRRLVISEDAHNPAVPTVAEYVPVVAETTSAGTRKAYGTYWARFAEEFGDRPVNAFTTSELALFVAAIRSAARQQANGVAGAGAAENAIAALRRFFAMAVADGMVTTNPAAAIPKPLRRTESRRALNDDELREVYEATVARSRDPQLHLLIIQIHLESGARADGVRKLRLRDVDPHLSRIRLREKGNTSIWQPVSPALIAELAAFAAERGVTDPDVPLLRDRHGRVLTHRHYDTMHRVWRRELPWAAREMVSSHWLRHTVGTRVERMFGTAVAKRFLRHVTTDITGVYTKATDADVAEAVQWLTGQPHPMLVRGA